jgi:hypothetical protein
MTVPDDIGVIAVILMGLEASTNVCNTYSVSPGLVSDTTSSF